MKYLKSVIKYIIGFFAKKRIFKSAQNTLFVICPESLGDTIIVASLMKSFKQYYKIKNVTVVVKSKSQYDLVSLFDAIDGVIVIKPLIMASLYMYRDNWSIDDVLHNNKNILWGFFNSQYLNDWNTMVKNNFFDSFRLLVLNIPQNSECEKLKNISCDVRIKDNSILLAPYCNSTKRFPISFWTRLADQLKTMGYNVYTNIGCTSDAAIPGTEVFFEKLKDAIPLFSEFVCVISSRSGISDILCFTNAYQIILYNNEFDYSLYKVEALNEISPVEIVMNESVTVDNICAYVKKGKNQC